MFVINVEKYENPTMVKEDVGVILIKISLCKAAINNIIINFFYIKFC